MGPPDDLVLRDILLRQIRKCHLLKYGIEAFDRASERSEQNSYAFLLQNIRDFLDRERPRSNRNRIIEKNKQGSDKPQPAAPAQGGNPRGKGDRGDRGRGRSRERSQGGKGDKTCYKFKGGKCDKGKGCPFKHAKDPKPRSTTPKKKGRGKKGCSPSEKQKSKLEMAKILIAGGGTRAFTIMIKLLPPQSPAQKKKASAKAAPCITQRYACIAKGKGLPKPTKAMKEQCHRAVVFSSQVECTKVPATGEQRKVVHRPRLYEKSYPRTEIVPKTDPLVIHRAQVVARQLQEVVKLFDMHPQPTCRFPCTTVVSVTICLATAKSSTRADEVANVTVDALHTDFIPSRRAVLSGQQAVSRFSPSRSQSD